MDGGWIACPFCVNCTCTEGVDAELTATQDRQDEPQ